MRRWLLGVLLIFGCKDPTEITVVVSTNLACSDLKGVGVAIGVPSMPNDAPPASTSTYCDDKGYVGALVVTPSASKDQELGVHVVASRQADLDHCFRAGGFDSTCVIARRALRFQPNKDLELPVFLDAACLGVPCDPQSTCSNGHCVPAAVSCDDGGSCVLPPDISDGGLDAGADPGCGVTTGLNAGASPMLGVCPTRVGRSRFALMPTGTMKTRSIPVKPFGSVFRYPPAIADDGEIVLTDGAGALFLVSPTLAVRTTGPVAGADREYPVVLHSNGSAIYRASASLLVSVFLAPSSLSRILAGPATADPVIGPDGLLYVGSTTGVTVREVPAMPNADWVLEPRASLPTDNPVEAAPSFSVDGKELIAVDKAGVVYVFDVAAKTLIEKSPAPLAANPIAPPTVDTDGALYVLSLGPGMTTLSAISRSPWSVRWQKAPAIPISPQPLPVALSRDGFVYVGAIGGSGVVGYDKKTGAQRSPIGVGLSLTPPAIDANDVAVYGTTSGQIVVQGKGPIDVMPNATFHSAVIAADGSIVVGDANAALLYIVHL